MRNEVKKRGEGINGKGFVSRQRGSLTLFNALVPLFSQDRWMCQTGYRRWVGSPIVDAFDRTWPVGDPIFFFLYETYSRAEVMFFGDKSGSYPMSHREK